MVGNSICNHANECPPCNANKNFDIRQLMIGYRPSPPGMYQRGLENWKSWVRRLRSYFLLANETDELRQRHIFLLEIGWDLMKRLEALLKPREPEDVPLEELIEILDKYFNPPGQEK